MAHKLSDFKVGDEVTVRDDVVDFLGLQGVVLRIQEVIPTSAYPLRLVRSDTSGRPLSTDLYFPVKVHEVEPLSISMEND